MAKKFRAKEKVVNKLSRDGIIEKNMVTGEEIFIGKKEQGFNLRSKADEPKLSLGKMSRKKKKALKKRFEKQARLQQGQEKLTESEPKTEIEIALPMNADLEIKPRDIQGVYKNRSPTKRAEVKNGKVKQREFYKELPEEQGFSEINDNLTKSKNTFDNEIRTHIAFSEERSSIIFAEKDSALRHEDDLKELQESENKSEPSKDKPSKIKNKNQSKNSQLQFHNDSRLETDDFDKSIEADESLKTLLDKKLEKLENKTIRANIKLEKAKGKLPTKNKLQVKRTFDEKKEKPKIKLQFEKEIIPQSGKPVSKPVKIAKYGVSVLKHEAINKVHSKISEVEHENVSIKAVHKTEQAIENFSRGKRITGSAYKFVKNAPYRKVSRLEKKSAKASRKFAYQDALKENPELTSNAISRYFQKQRIKKQYAKKFRENKNMAASVQTTANFIKEAAKKTAVVIVKNPAVSGTIVVILLIFLLSMSMANTLTSVFTGSLTPIIASSYTASDLNIDSAELAYTEWETNLLLEARRAETSYPGYDKYHYSIGDIGHNPYELMAYLTIKYQDFEFAAIESDLRKIFEEQYQLTFTESIESRLNEETGEYFDYKIMNVELVARSFTNVIYSKLDSEQRKAFELYMETKGNRQYMVSPFDFNWISKISSYYGWRINKDGAKEYHKGVDISVPVGTDVLAGHDGIISAAAYDSTYGYYLVIDGENGLQSKYAHCDKILASVGQSVKKGDIIAKSGNSGKSEEPHLHLEVLKNGIHLNPLYFVTTKDTGDAPEYGNAGPEMGDGSYAALIAEAEKYLGFPYVWGGSTPESSFDCSGFVCWVFTKSGNYNLPRTTAQGIYEQSTPIPPSEARPGDLIFFTGTYSTTNPVTHIGIYVGNGKMIHAGDPIGYASVNSSYWQNHFYSYGRLS